ncbi:SGNH/GDSL hydrolase family protein [Verrucomicrobiales bacterium BCK34]|nr:SGNH/GDSL hydrolase family protein [Verrucomicrobiales bacterium BCK34]
MKPTSVRILLCCLAFSLASSVNGEEPLLKSGDRIALIGNTVIERARLHGHIEESLQLAAGPEVKNLTIRNLGWSGDSVFGDSRSYFGPPQEGRERLSAVISEFKPQVIFLCYGTGAAMSVDQGWTDEPIHKEPSANGLQSSLEIFVKGYQEKIDRLRSAAGGSLREIVLISPPPLENLGDPLPDQTGNNARLAVFRDQIKQLASANQLRFVDWFAALGGDDFNGEVASPALTNNGVHYSESGYQILGRELVKGLGYGETSATQNTADSPLMAAIIEKNRLFFHRWRPANETYLFLFRKHEQGQNAKEIPMFDPLIAEQDKKIEAARQALFAGKPKN